MGNWTPRFCRRRVNFLSKRPLVIAGIVLASLLVIGGVSAFVYYQSLKQTPQYSLALLIDAARRDDKAELDARIDVGAVVDDFMPQVSGKAIEMYGRGQPPEILQKAARLALPLLPAVKERARAELPRVIRERTAQFNDVPFFAMAMGAERYVDIKIDGDVAFIRSVDPEHQFEAKMRRVGDRWQIVGIRDDELATAIARRIGQELMTIAAYGDKYAAEKFGIGNLSDLIRGVEELLK